MQNAVACQWACCVFVMFVNTHYYGCLLIQRFLKSVDSCSYLSFVLMILTDKHYGRGPQFIAQAEVFRTCRFLYKAVGEQHIDDLCSNVKDCVEVEQ